MIGPPTPLPVSIRVKGRFEENNKYFGGIIHEGVMLQHRKDSFKILVLLEVLAQQFFVCAAYDS